MRSAVVQFVCSSSCFVCLQVHVDDACLFAYSVCVCVCVFVFSCVASFMSCRARVCVCVYVSMRKYKHLWGFSHHHTKSFCF